MPSPDSRRTSPCTQAAIAARAQELDLDLNRGPKAGIAKQAQNSPQRYSAAFKSRAPRLASPAGCKTAFRGNMYSYDANRSTGRRQDMRPGWSKTPRFKAPQASIGADRMQSSSTLERDARHWSRNSFYQSQAPRSVEQQRPLTADIDTNDMPNAGHHVDGAVLPLAQASRVSPRKVASMLNRESRSSDPVAYAASDPRFRRLRLPYDEVLGPGSYDTSAAEEYLRASTPADGSRAVFASRLPQHEAPSGPRPLVPAAGASAFAIDARSWDRPIYRSGSPSGRSRERGPQLGSWEGLNGLGRAHSPEQRSPDTVYHGIGRAPQKRALVEDQVASARRYAASFQSRAERLMTPDTVRRALQMSPTSGLFDVGDMTGPMSMSIGSSGDGRPSSPFKSTQPRFPPDRRVATPAHDSAAAEDRRAWTSAGQPMTTKAERATIFDETVIKPTSPGPMVYGGIRDWSPPTSPARNGAKKRPTFGDSLGQLPRAGSPY